MLNLKISFLLKKFSKVFFILLLPSLLFSKEIYWYIGSAFIKPAEEISNIYKTSKVVIISGGSGVLMQKILLSKKGDLFMPGTVYYEKVLKNRGIVLLSKKLIKQMPVFATLKNNCKIRTFKDLYTKNIKIALGNSDTMALGKLFLKILNRFPNNIKKSIISRCVVKGINVAQIVNYIKMKIVDAGIVFDSVAKVNNLKIINIPDKYRIDDVAPILVLKYSKNKKEAIKFFNFVLSHKQIFEKYGYKTL